MRGEEHLTPSTKDNWLVYHFPDPKKTMKLCTKPIDFSHMPAERGDINKIQIGIHAAGMGNGFIA